MALNEVYRGPLVFLDLNVGANTFKPGDTVKVGGFMGVCQTASDGGVAAGYGVTPVPTGSLPNGGTVARGRRQAANHSTVAIRGGHKVSVVATAAMNQGDSV